MFCTSTFIFYIVEKCLEKGEGLVEQYGVNSQNVMHFWHKILLRYLIHWKAVCSNYFGVKFLTCIWTKQYYLDLRMALPPKNLDDNICLQHCFMMTRGRRPKEGTPYFLDWRNMEEVENKTWWKWCPMETGESLELTFVGSRERTRGRERSRWTVSWERRFGWTQQIVAGMHLASHCQLTPELLSSLSAMWGQLVTPPSPALLCSSCFGMAWLHSCCGK